MNRRSLLQTLTAGAVLATLPALSQAQQKGKDYIEIVPPQPGGTGGNVEVLEFFSFMCPHCHEFEPRLQPWVKKLPAGVSFKRIPVGFGRPDWTALSRMYITLNVMGLNEKLDAKVFEAIHTQRIPLHDEKQRNQWLTKQGVDVAKFNDTWRSFGVESQLKRAEQLARDYKVPGVPSLAINGRYLVSAGENVFKVADQFIAQAKAGK